MIRQDGRFGDVELDGRPGEIDALVGRAVSDCRRVGVAFSGGVDSSVLAALLARHIGSANVVLLLGVSASLARRERRLAHTIASDLGLTLVEVATNELDNADYRANPVDRCYFCKDELFALLGGDVMERYSLDAIAYGANSDDAARPDRPGSLAAAEHNIIHPLVDAGATKSDVRAIAAAFGLANAAKPAAPCLASRIPHGFEVTPEKLDAIDAGEDIILSYGFSDCRLRHHGDIARIELPASEFGRLLEGNVREEIAHKVRGCGFRHVVIDLDGIQSGAFTLKMLAASMAARA